MISPLIKRLPPKFYFEGNLGSAVLVLVLMAITVVAFDPLVHQKVRYREQLYAVLLKDIDLAQIPPNSDVPIYFVSHEKILFRQEIGRQFMVKRKELTLVEPHIIE